MMRQIIKIIMILGAMIVSGCIVHDGHHGNRGYNDGYRWRSSYPKYHGGNHWHHR